MGFGRGESGAIAVNTRRCRIKTAFAPVNAGRKRFTEADPRTPRAECERILSVEASRHPVLLYDGVCALCNRLVKFVLQRDARGEFHFASLQSKYAAEVLRRHGLDPQDLDTFYIVVEPGGEKEHVVARSEAGLEVLRRIGGVWRLASVVARILPRFVRDFAYNRIARNRYQVFGKYDACPLPPPEVRGRFIDV
jgi:predicted DCC family thiol-disulfide oxidoreductase YuxK